MIHKTTSPRTLLIYLGSCARLFLNRKPLHAIYRDELIPCHTMFEPHLLEHITPNCNSLYSWPKYHTVSYIPISQYFEIHVKIYKVDSEKNQKHGWTLINKLYCEWLEESLSYHHKDDEGRTGCRDYFIDMLKWGAFNITVLDGMKTKGLKV